MIAECLYIGPGARELKRLNGNGTSLTFLNDGDSQNIGYDGVQRITRLRHKLPGGQDFIDREFEYNRASMRTRDRRNDDSGQENEYSYDSVHRLISSRYDQNGSGGAQRDLGQQRFTFDGVGNRRNVEETRQSQGVSNEAYAVNEMNEYSSVSGVTRNHDDNGNLIDDGNFLYSYDAKDRLVRVFNKGSGNLVADYLYDCGNRRTKKIVYSQVNPGQVEKETNFFYDGWEVCEEQSSTGQTKITYVYGNGIDEIVEFSRTANHPLGAGQFYCHQDIQKNVVAVTDASGALVEKTFYDAYGAPLDSNKQPISLNAVGNPYGFQGRRLDAETGLYYFRHRYYSPETGRFIQRDPVWDANNVGNQYSFANSNIINGMDPFGLNDAMEYWRLHDPKRYKEEWLKLNPGKQFPGEKKSSSSVLSLKPNLQEMTTAGSQSWKPHNPHAFKLPTAEKNYEVGCATAQFGKQVAIAWWDEAKLAWRWKTTCATRELKEGNFGWAAVYQVGGDAILADKMLDIVVVAKGVLKAGKCGVSTLKAGGVNGARSIQVEKGFSQTVIVAADRVPPLRIGVSKNAPNYCSVPNIKEGRIWVSTCDIVGSDFYKMALKRAERGDKFVILTGTHGDSFGNIGCSLQARSRLGMGRRTSLNLRKAYNTDVGIFSEFKGKGVVVIDVTTLTNKQLEKILRSKTNIVAGWCKSERSKAIVEVSKDLNYFGK